MNQNVQPQFEVEQLDGTVEKTLTFFEDGELKTKTTEEAAGYMVYFPQGHSFRVKNFAELKRLGLHTAPGLVDMESGETVATPQKMSLKTQVASKTKPSRNSKS